MNKNYSSSDDTIYSSDSDLWNDSDSNSSTIEDNNEDDKNDDADTIDSTNTIVNNHHDRNEVADPRIVEKARLPLLSNNKGTSNEEDYNMSIINENEDDNTSCPTTAESSQSQNSILSLVNLPNFLDEILDIVQCPISYDTMKIPTYA